MVELSVDGTPQGTLIGWLWFLNLPGARRIGRPDENGWLNLNVAVEHHDT